MNKQQNSNLKLKDKLLFLIDMIDSVKHFAAWIEPEGGEEVKEEDKSQFQYKEELDVFGDEHGQFLSLDVLYDNVRFDDMKTIAYPVSGEDEQIERRLIYYLPEDFHYFTFDGKSIVVYKEKPRKYEVGWVSTVEQYVLPYGRLFTDLSEEYVYEIIRHEID